MIATLRQLFRASSAHTVPSIPEGERVYAIGDIHGRLDLLQVLIAAIEMDDAARGAADTTIVLLGDLIDRGPDSAGVLTFARKLQKRRQVRIIAGNHEEMFLKCFDDADLLRHFLIYGGRETLLSYPIDAADLDRATLKETQALMRGAVPAADMDFIRSFEDMIAIGDYLFVHAGIRPGVPLEQQELEDLRWIRSPFLESGINHGCVVVHGHTIHENADFQQNRIGIDTGAYASGRLTALCLEATDRWLIETQEDGGMITTATRSAE